MTGGGGGMLGRQSGAALGGVGAGLVGMEG